MSASPTRMPSTSPSMVPTEEASMVPSSSPSSSPSQLPSSIPSDAPSSFPSSMPSKEPTPVPTPGPTPTPAPIYPSHYKVNWEYAGTSMGSTTNNEFECDAYCSTIWTQGSVAWTFYTDVTSGDNCKCLVVFGTPRNGQVKANAISGRFVPEGNPTAADCRDKCNMLSTELKPISPFSGGIDECVDQCTGATVSSGNAAEYAVVQRSLWGGNDICYCYRNIGYFQWDASFESRPV